MTQEDYFNNLGEHEYCMWAMSTLINKMNIKEKDTRSPLDKMIDNATGNSGVVWEDVAMLVLWLDRIIELREYLEIPFDATKSMNLDLINLMKKFGKLDFYEKAKLEMKED